MKTDKATDAGTLVERPPTTLKESIGTSHPRRSTETEISAEEVALMQEEDRIVDEEITSEEESETTMDRNDRNILTMALVKSVVDTGTHPVRTTTNNNHGHHALKPLTKPPEPTSPRYGLRKRRRPAGGDLKKLEHNQVSKDGGLARVVLPTTTTTTTTTPRTLVSAGDKRSFALKEDPPQPVLDPCSSVPNPLAPTTTASVTVEQPETRASPPPPPPPPPPLQQPPQRAKSPVPEAPAAVSSAVPCPLPAISKGDVSSPRVEPNDKKKVTINEFTRTRGFSIDLESVGLDFPDEGSTQADSSLAGGRNRGFSFECFAFGINADEPLPPLGHNDMDSTSTGRPRGDSIIFDPSSFQEGGIHEQNALEKALAPATEIPGIVKRPVPVQSPPPILPANPPPPVAPLPATVPSNPDFIAPPPETPGTRTHPGVAVVEAVENSAPQPLPAVSSYTATTITSTSANITTTTITTTQTSGTASFSMELLNKDGRIGIYLPEARKARIARFHAKRARRIWRKRIKYDCRKKLADSRPRIKGRFVKRSDMEED